MRASALVIVDQAANMLLVMCAPVCLSKSLWDVEWSPFCLTKIAEHKSETDQL